MPQLGRWLSHCCLGRVAPKSFKPETTERATVLKAFGVQGTLQLRGLKGIGAEIDVLHGW